MTELIGTLGLEPRTPWTRSLVGIATVGLAMTLTLLPGCTSNREERGLFPSPASTSRPTPSSAPSGRTSAPPPGVVEIALPLGTNPVGVVAAGRDLWVTSKNSTKLFRIDPQRNRVAQTIDIGQQTCGQPFANADVVITMPCTDATTTVVVDARSGTIRGRLHDAAGLTLATAAGSIWIGNFDGTTLKRYEASTLKLQQEMRIPSGLLGYDGHMVWNVGTDVTGKTFTSLMKIDPARPETVVARYRLPAMDTPFMADSGDFLWFKPIRERTLYRFTKASGRLDTIRLVGWFPLAKFADQPIIVNGNDLWCRTRSSVVSQLDARLGMVRRTYPADPAGAGGHLAIASGSLWVANYATDTVWRADL